MYIDRYPNAYRYRSESIRMVYRKGIFDIHGISLYTHKVIWISCYIPCISTNAISYVFLCTSYVFLCTSYVFLCFSQAQNSVYTWMIMVYCIT